MTDKTYLKTNVVISNISYELGIDIMFSYMQTVWFNFVTINK